MVSDTSARTDFRSGLVDGLPFAPGVGLLGAVFGASAGPAGIDAGSAVLMSFVVWSGAGQFAALPLWREGAWVVATTAFVLSLRFALRSASMAPLMAEARVPRPWRALLAFCVTDESYALAVTRRGGQHKPFYLLGAWVPLYVPWVLGTLVGVVLGAVVPEAWRTPLEAVFPLVFLTLTLTILVCTNRSFTVVALLGAALSIACTYVLPSGWNAIVAGLLASLAGPLLQRRLGSGASE